jgi:cytochrome d ubiquinol oxidase subunit II
LYASAFSGFYLPLMMILWLLIFRAIGLELRGQVDHPMWRQAWDLAFGMASLLLALFFGLALGNVARGVNLGGYDGSQFTLEPQYFFLPLWNSSLSPFSHHLGIIDWFTLVLGLVGLLSLTIHGAAWIIYKTNASINPLLRDWLPKLAIGQGALVILSLVAWLQVRPNAMQNFLAHPLLFIFPLIAFLGWIGLLFSKKMKRDGQPFLASATFIAGTSASTAVAVFPVLLPSSNGLQPDLDIYNCAAPAYGLQTGLYWWPVAAILVVVYLVAQYRIFKGKMDDVEYGEH